MRVWIHKKWQLVNATFGWFHFEDPFSHFFHFFEFTKNVFFEFFSKGVIFSALLNKTFLNRFIESVSMDKAIWHQFFQIR